VINEHIREPWPEDVRQTLSEFRQGDVVEAPPFFYVHGGAIRLWEPPEDEDEDDAAGDEFVAFASQVEELHPDDAPPLGIITSQTCDLDEQGMPTQVWFQVSPVYRIPDDGREAERLLSKQYTIELDGPELPDGRWLADLRIELPIEKSWLIARRPMRGFSSEDQAEAFGRKIGRRRARPALANRLVDTVTGLVRARKQVRSPGSLKRLTREIWAEDVYRIMLDIEGGTRLEPIAVRLHVVCRGDPTERAQEWFADWEDEARKAAGDAGIELHATHFHNGRTINLHEYDRWIELDFS
jgi:hypothetical protein